MKLSRFCLPCRVGTAGYSLERYHPVVLVSCGSFNPPTYMHLRMLELAQTRLTKVCAAAGSGAGAHTPWVPPGLRALPAAGHKSQALSWVGVHVSFTRWWELGGNPLTSNHARPAPWHDGWRHALPLMPGAP